MCSDRIIIHLLDQVEVRCKVESQASGGRTVSARRKKRRRRHDVSFLLSFCKSHELDVFKAERGAVAEWVGTMGVFAETIKAILA